VTSNFGQTSGRPFSFFSQAFSAPAFLFISLKLTLDVIFVSDLSPISGLISDEFLKRICRRFGKIVQSLVLDGCHRITGKVLCSIAVMPSLSCISLKW
jgi:hypothetical protein